MSFVIYSPIIYIFLGIFDLYFNWPVQSEHIIFMQIWANIIMLNTVHVVFFIPAFLSSDFRKTLMKDGEGKIFFLICSVGFIFLFLVDAYAVGLLKSSNRMTDVLEIFGKVIIAVLPPFHALRQSYGISRLLEDRAYVRKYKWVDFSMYHATLFFAVVLNLSALFASNDSLFRNKFVYIWSMMGLTSIFLLVVFFSKSNWQKKFFQLRLLLWPLGMLSTPAGIMNAATHGTEYAYLSYKMRELVKGSRLLLITLALVFFIVILYLFHCAKMDSEFSQLPVSQFVVQMTTLLLAVIQVHYIVDTIFFSNKEVIRKVAILFKKA